MKTPLEICKYLTHGVYVIAVTDGSRESAFTAAWVMQVSFKPLLIAFSINPLHRSYEILKSSGQCSINILDEQQLHIAEHFGRSDLKDKMTGFKWQYTKCGSLVLGESICYFDCTVSHIAPAGDHELVVCSVIGSGFLNSGVPMLYRETGNMDGTA